MLPIDEHAKSGVEVWVFGPNAALLGKYDAETDAWMNNIGLQLKRENVVGYLPVPLVENAAKMREELEAFADLVESDLCRELPETRQLLSATEWPEVKGE